jgi:hypothetical protein
MRELSEEALRDGEEFDDDVVVEPRKAHFRVKLHLDGAPECTVTIERGTTHQLLTVRPLGKRTAYTLGLSTVAEMVAYRIAKVDAEKLLAEKGKKRRRR